MARTETRILEELLSSLPYSMHNAAENTAIHMLLTAVARQIHTLEVQIECLSDVDVMTDQIRERLLNEESDLTTKKEFKGLRSRLQAPWRVNK